jgi:UDP-N-acetylmuramoyl-L-alanyl-D-glutamate--2,6-diaminopimelate ligase
MQQYEAGGRRVLDDTAGHPDSLQATFEVAAMLARAPTHPAGTRTVVVYAVRGNRGIDINRRNARALADLAAEFGTTNVIVSAAADTTGEHDHATPEEVDAVRAAFAARGQSIDWHDTLAGAARAALGATSPGDLIVLVGAQGMNEGQRVLLEVAAGS